MVDTLQLTGFKELAAALREMPERVARNGLRAAVNAGATVIKKEARKNAPVASGLLKKNIYQKQIPEAPGSERQTFVVGVRTKRSGRLYNKDGSKKQQPYYWRFMEFGTSKLPPAPFMRPAFDAQKDAAIQAIADKLDERIQKHAKDLAKQ